MLMLVGAVCFAVIARRYRIALASAYSGDTHHTRASSALTRSVYAARRSFRASG